MSKIITLTESDLIKIIKTVLNEQGGKKEYVTNFDNAYDYMRQGDNYYTSKKGKNKWILTSGSAKEAIKTKVFKVKPSSKSKNNYAKHGAGIESPTSASKMMNPNLFSGAVWTANKEKPKPKNETVTSLCQVIKSNSDITDLSQIVKFWKTSYPNVETYGLINRTLNRYATNYKASGIPTRISCEVALLQIRPGYKNKNAIVVDTLNKLLYIFNSSGQFIAKTVIISGGDKQSLDSVKIAESLLDWEEQANKLGFKWFDGKGYVDITGKGRKYNPNLVYNDTKNKSTRFLPKGIYTTSNSLHSDSEYAGTTNNMLSLFKGNKEISQAIHGYYIEQPRTLAISKAEQVLSNPNDPNVSNEFMSLVSSGSVNLSQSYGCINVPLSFMSYLRKYTPNSYVFNIGEDKQNYLVDNTNKFFDKMMNSNSCPSPKSLGAIPISDLA